MKKKTQNHNSERQNNTRVPKQELKDRGQKLPHKTHSDLGYMCKKIHPAENCNR